MSEYRGKHSASADAPRPSSRSEKDLAYTSLSEGKEGPRGSSRYVGYSIGNLKPEPKPVLTVVKVVLAVVVVALLVFGGYTLAQTLGAFDSEVVAGTEVTVFIPEGSTTSEIASILKKAGVIEKESSFKAAVIERGVESQLLPGRYTLETGMSDGAVIEALLAGPVPAVAGNKLTIPEGLTLEATAARVEEVCGIPAADFIAEAYSADKYVADYPFLEGVYNNSLEGFLYPKTYQIPEGSDAEYVIRVLLDQFAIETADLDLSFAEGKNLTYYDVIIIASMIEKEVLVEEERPLVASVIYNRLHEGMRLQICATIVYAIGWSDYDGHPLLESDLEIDSPYNTYLIDELPVGPICSPRIESIVAAAQPSETDYLYYVLASEDGTHAFCATYEEFETANAAYHELFNVPN